MNETVGRKTQRRLPSLACALLVLAAIAVVHPVGEIPMGDEIAYAHVAQTLARTGHITYAGAINAMAGWQIYWGAAVIRIFGFSLLALRWSIAAIAVMTAFLMHRIFVRAGVRSVPAAAGTLTFCLSPLFLANATAFLTDVPGVLAVLVCLYACIRALQAASVRATILWLAVAIIGNSLLGSARQYAWLAGLVMAPSVLWLLRRNRNVVFAGCVLTAIGLAMDCAMQYWFMHQPYTNREATLLLGLTPRRMEVLCLEGLGVLLETGLMLLPVSLTLLPVLWRKPLPKVSAVVCVLFGCGVAGLWHLHQLQALAIPYLGSSYSWPLPLWAKAAVTAFDLLGLLALVTMAATKADSPGEENDASRVSTRGLMVLLLPFLLVNLLVLLPRAYNPGLWDRYLLPTAAILLLGVLRGCQARFRRSGLLMACALGFGAYATALIHDNFAVQRARLGALNEMVSRGVPRTAVTGGWPYDFETELQIRPYLASEGVRLPQGVKLPPPTSYGMQHCQGFQCAMVPDVVPAFATTAEAGQALPGFAPVPYRGWATPSGAIYVKRFQ